MTISDKNAETTEPANKVDNTQLDMLKGVADTLGIKYSNQIGVAALSEKIKAYKPEIPAAPQVQVVHVPLPAEEAPAVDIKKAQQIQIAKIRKDQEKLERVIVTCMNPAKREHPGAYFMVSNSFISTMKKMVPFNNENGWHVPHMIVNMIKECRFQMTKTVKDSNGVERQESFTVPEYNVVHLPPLTPEELKELAREQARKRSID